MANDSYCNDSCSGCYTCEDCNSCELCDEDCETPCQSKQTFCKDCQTFGEYGSFSFSYSPEEDNIIGPGYFDQDVWDEIIKYINRLRTKGNSKLSGGITGSAIDLSSTINVVPFKASEFNRITNYIIDEDGKKVTSASASAGELIYGSYFQDLEADVEKAELKSTACDSCNAGCQGCDGCELCNTSNSDDCGSGQKCSDMVNNGCQSCDSCENHCDDTPSDSDSSS